MRRAAVLLLGVFAVLLLAAMPPATAQTGTPTTTPVPAGQGGVDQRSPQNAPGTGPATNYDPPGGGATGGGASGGGDTVSDTSSGWSGPALYGLLIAGVLIVIALALYSRARPAARQGRQQHQTG